MAAEDDPLPTNGMTYRDAGVDIEAGNDLVDRIKPLAASTLRPGADTMLGGFGGLFDLKSAGYTDPILVAANDGVGTKLKIAIEADIHDTVGIDLVAMCVNDLVVQGAEPLFFLDYFATGKLDPEAAEAVLTGIADGCRQAGAALIGGETAEMPGMYADGDYDLAGFAVGAAERGTLLPRVDIVAGDVILGLASNGLHSNGFSLVRKLVDNAGLNYHDPAPFHPDRSLAEALLAPTRIYTRPVLAAQNETGAIKALAHITGGGFTENLPRVLPDSLCAAIELDRISLPPVFSWLAQQGGITQAELLRTFNCGIGMVLLTAPDEADAVSRALQADGETVSRLGVVADRENDSVTYSGALGA